jgi:hypothetical protein
MAAVIRLLLGIWCVLFVSSLIKSRPLAIGFTLAHAAIFAYAIGAFIGYRNSVADFIAKLPLGRIDALVEKLREQRGCLWLIRWLRMDVFR